MELIEFRRRFHHIRQVDSADDYPLRRQGRPAAVLIPVVTHKQLTILFTQRADHLKHHGGQISFPGGRQEPEDTSLLDTALRETQEEIGLNVGKHQVVGQLTPFRTISGFEVTPYIALVKPGFSLTTDSNEVDHAFEVPLSHLVNPDNHLIHKVERNGESRDVVFIPWEDYMIWGATAAFVKTLSHHLHDPDDQ